ncbi:MAG: hypothetical protein IJS20_03375 [Bacteroidales bacterium]|nr:hypothetical protein [Bacteroidales bacterium]
MKMNRLLLFAACSVLMVSCAEEQETFEGVEGDHAYVDLGLPSGLKWATCNIGASAPEDYGDYFAWGETSGYQSGKTNFTWNNCKYCNSSTITKYCTDSRYGDNGFADYKNTLDLTDDAAHANWGGSWRTPTQTECQELIDNCISTWTTVYGVSGRLFKSKKNGKTLFLPAAGLRIGVDFDSGDSPEGLYWTSSLCSDVPCSAWFLYSRRGSDGVFNQYRYIGISVRAVCP